jgi:hypothetical protein
MIVRRFRWSRATARRRELASECTTFAAKAIKARCCFRLTRCAWAAREAAVAAAVAVAAVVAAVADV